MLDHNMYLLYKRLKDEGKIGRIWDVENGYLVAPLDAIKWFEHTQAHFVPESRFWAMLQELDGVAPTLQRKPPQTETFTERYQKAKEYHVKRRA